MIRQSLGAIASNTNTYQLADGFWHAIAPAAIACVVDAQCVGIDSDVCTCDRCSAGFCASSVVAYGNVNCSATQQPNLDDILFELADFSDGGTVTHPSNDLAPACTGNGLINIDDLLAVLAAFSGADPCGCL